MKYEWSKRRRYVAAIGAPTGNVDAGAASDAAQRSLCWQQFPVFNLLLLSLSLLSLLLSANELRQQTYYNLVQWLCPAIEATLATLALRCAALPWALRLGWAALARGRYLTRCKHPFSQNTHNTSPFISSGSSSATGNIKEVPHTCTHMHTQAHTHRDTLARLVPDALISHSTPRSQSYSIIMLLFATICCGRIISTHTSFSPPLSLSLCSSWTLAWWPPSNRITRILNLHAKVKRFASKSNRFPANPPKCLDDTLRQMIFSWAR